MARDRHPLTRALVLAGIAAGCAPADELRFRLVHGIDDDPYAFGAQVVLALETSGRQVAPERAFSIDASILDLGPLPHGTDLRLRAEVRSDGVVLARGFSYPFDHVPDAPAGRAPDVLIGSLGRFTRTTVEPPDATAVAIAVAADGARFVTALGTVYAYRAHGEGGDARLEVLGRAPPHRQSGRWAAIGRQGFVGVGGSTSGASFVDAETAEALERSDALAAHGADPLVVGFAEGALAIGGSIATEPSAAVTWLEVQGGELREVPRPPLPAPVVGGRAVAATLEVAGELRPVALVLGRAEAWILDPAGAQAARRSTIDLDHLEGAAIAAIGPGLVLVAGGRGPTGASAEIDLLIVRDEGVAVLSPRPRALAVERVDAAVIPFGVGRALIAGGSDAFELPRDTSELFEVRVDDLPGDAVPTGRLPLAAGRPLGVALDDGSVLVVDRALLAHYFSPRSP